MDSFSDQPHKKKVVFIIGATGTGKSKLSIDLATQFPAEIINSDKMQVYKGLDIVTNKISEVEQFGIPHHLLGVLDPNAEFTAADFRRLTLEALESIVERNRLPIIVGGSNSFIKALVDDEQHEFRSKYDCCFIWLDVSMDVLHSFVSKRVDQMVNAGLVDEVRDFFDPNGDYDSGVRRAIGVSEMDLYLRLEQIVDEKTRIELQEMAIEEIKINTCKLACYQIEKIRRLQNLPGWNINHIDATDAFCKLGVEAAELWEKLVVQPSTMIVEQFLYKDVESTNTITTTIATSVATASVSTTTTAIAPIILGAL